MKDVSRSDIPSSLKKDGKKWTRDLLKAIALKEQDGTDIPKAVYGQYKQDDVLLALKNMYGDGVFTWCCYCETIINTASYEHIEHRKPKSPNRFPRDTFNWDNLHLACQRCNTAKGNKWNNKASILDAVTHVPISAHFEYKLGPLDMRTLPLSPQAKTTISHTKLDRKTMRKKRLILYNDIVETIREIRMDKNETRKNAKIEILYEQALGENGSVITWAMRQWGLLDD